MAVPQVIQSQIEAAEQLQAELYPGAPETPPPEVTPASSDASPPAPQTADVIEITRPAEPVKTEVAEDARYWKARFDTLQGKFNAEVPALHQQLKEQGRELATMRQTLEELRTQPPETPPAASEPLVSEADVEAFGADLVHMTERVSRATVKSEVDKAVAEVYKRLGVVQEQMGHVVATAEQSTAERFWNTVIAKVPDWAEVDKDPAWIAFLDSTPEFAERTYREMAGDAISRGNPDKIASLVRLWRGESPAPAASPTPPAAPNPQAELQRQVAPSSSKASTPAPQGERLWSKADYEAAYDVRNVMRYGEKKAAEMVAEADRAVAEGRVRW